MDYGNHSYFVYLRTKIAFELDTEAQRALTQMRGDTNTVLSVGPDRRAFIDGLVLNVRTYRVLEELKNAWFRHLSKFDAWAIHDGNENVFENINGGPACTGLNALISSSSSLKQIFVVFYPSGNDEPHRFDADATIHTLVGLLPQPTRSVFYFRNGRILLLRTDIPIGILMRRFERAFPLNTRRDGRVPYRPVYEIGVTSPDDVGGRWYYGGGAVWEDRFLPGTFIDAVQEKHIVGSKANR